MLQEEVIEQATTEWASPIFFAPMTGGSLRFFISYRTINDITIRDLYSLPRTDEYIGSLGNNRIFSSLHTNLGYCQVKSHEGDRKEPALISLYSLYNFLDAISV